MAFKSKNVCAKQKSSKEVVMLLSWNKKIQLMNITNNFSIKTNK